MSTATEPATPVLIPNDPKNPLCYNCMHNGGVVLGSSHHIRCLAPMKVKNLFVKSNEHGVRNGWFIWPFNFDPIWLESCSAYTAKNQAQP